MIEVACYAKAAREKAEAERIALVRRRLALIDETHQTAEEAVIHEDRIFEHLTAFLEGVRNGDTAALKARSLIAESNQLAQGLKQDAHILQTPAVLLGSEQAGEVSTLAVAVLQHGPDILSRIDVEDLICFTMVYRWFTKRYLGKPILLYQPPPFLKGVVKHGKPKNTAIGE